MELKGGVLGWGGDSKMICLEAAFVKSIHCFIFIIFFLPFIMAALSLLLYGSFSSCGERELSSGCSASAVQGFSVVKHQL